MDARDVVWVTEPIEEMLIEILTPSELNTLYRVLYSQILEPGDSPTGSIPRVRSHLRSNYCLVRDETCVCLVAKVVYEEIYGQAIPGEIGREKGLQEFVISTTDAMDCLPVGDEVSTLTRSVSTLGTSVSTAMMSGGRSENCPLPALQDFYLDAVVCVDDLMSQVTYQPLRIIKMQELRLYDILENVQSWNALGDDFLITPLGLYRADSDASRSQGSSDTMIIEALFMRGGRVPASLESQHVIYPEDLVPYVDVVQHPVDNHYWELVYAQGRIWDEI